MNFGLNCGVHFMNAKSFSLEELAKHYAATQSDVSKYVRESDYIHVLTEFDRLCDAVVDAISYMPGGQNKADLRDAYDHATIQLQRHHSILENIRK